MSRHSAVCVCCTLMYAGLSLTAQAQPTIVISQVYGGAGNSGAILRNDFVELFNRGSSAVSISGWTIQYASASGSSWDRAALSGTIQPGQYFLVQLARGTGGSAALPTPDATGGVNLSATSGKVALVNSSNPLTGPSPSGTQVVDFVGYGNATFAEGRPAPELTNTTAAVRRGGGCTDTDNNQADFTSERPSPRNTRSAASPCFTPVIPQISAAGVKNAASFAGGSVAPGEIVTISGSSLGPEAIAGRQLADGGRSVATTLSGTRVLFDGVAAPVIYARATQVTAAVPYGVHGRRSTELQIEYNGKLSNRVALEVAPTAPGIFTSDSSGRGLAATVNQDRTINNAANPAPKASVVTLYATGGGQTVPAGEDGRITAGAAPGRQLEEVSAQVCGIGAEVLYAGPAPGLVSGVLQVNLRVPESCPAGLQSVQISAGGVGSQSGVVVAIAGSDGQAGMGPVIDARIEQLRKEYLPQTLPEIPTDRDGIPTDWLSIISWNIQVGGTSTASDSPRPQMVWSALGGMYSGTYQLLAAQEVPNSDSAEYLRRLLPGGRVAVWMSAFIDSTDSMDNGFWYRTSGRNGAFLRDSFLLSTTDRRDSAGRIIADESRAVHPPHVAQFEVGDFDFTIISLHLTFANGDTSESVRELRGILDYLDWYFDQPDHDPDVIVCGDFNIPSVMSGQTGRGGITLDDVFDRDPRFQIGERRFVVTVHEPTSRSSAANGGGPARNYDHCVLSADTLEEFIQARRVSTNILTDHPEDPEARLTSDHFPIVALFKTRGEGISLDLRRRIRPNQ